jgi:predicted nucleic acid-binding protein
MIVVSDASPLRALFHLQLLSICKELYGTILVPETVRQELNQPTTVCPAFEITAHPGFEARTPRSHPADHGVPSDLDAGETQAITLALELRADLVLMDERKGTAAARHLGLATVGVIGVLLEAKRKNLIQNVMPCVNRLVDELKFFVSPALRQKLAVLANE